jgi:serine/threonine protein kinase
MVDWWALGILTWELFVGFSPYSSGNDDPTKIAQNILQKPIFFPSKELHSIDMTDECK